MKKWSFIAGVIVSVVLLVASAVAENWRLSFNIAGVIGLCAWLISGIFTGAFVSGDRMRANHNAETAEERWNRIDMATVLFLFGLPNVVIAVTVYFMALS
jgi:hypothetical protein